MNLRVCVGLLMIVSGMSTTKVELPPLFAVEISNLVAEPSGATFCSTTGSLFVICDTWSECPGVYEMDFEGNILQVWNYPGKRKDVEAVTCDDHNQLLYIAEEGQMRITSYVLPHSDDPLTYTLTKHNRALIELDQLVIDLSDWRVDYDDDDPPGLEGLTWNPLSQQLMMANEKRPTLILSVTPSTGKIEEVINPSYVDDLSGLAYDDELQLLWVLSDKQDRMFLTNLTGETVLDAWDLPMENAEGIAVDNTSDPPMIYIFTDPSSPHGKQYVAAMFSFEKPVQGTGRLYPNRQEASSVQELSAEAVCNGCETVWEYLDGISTFISSNEMTSSRGGNHWLVISLSTSLAVLAVLLFATLAAVIVLFRWRRTKKHSATNLENPPSGVGDSDSVE